VILKNGKQRRRFHNRSSNAQLAGSSRRRHADAALPYWRLSFLHMSDGLDIVNVVPKSSNVARRNASEAMGKEHTSGTITLTGRGKVIQAASSGPWFKKFK